jgi:hypothetical protein
MKRRTKEIIGKSTGNVIGTGIGLGLAYLGLKGLSNAKGGLFYTKGLYKLGKLLGGGMKTGLCTVCVGTAGTAVAGGEIGKKVASKIGNKKK